MNRDISAREPNAGKRKRISFDPYLRHEHIVKLVTSKPGDQVQQDKDDREPDMIHHLRISARLEEERRLHYLSNRGVQ